MITTILLNLQTGTTSIQVERTRRWRAHVAKLAKKKDGEGEDWDPRLRLWIPLPLEESERGGEVVRVDPGLPLFDMGTRENRRRLLGSTWRDWFGESVTFVLLHETDEWMSTRSITDEVSEELESRHGFELTSISCSSVTDTDFNESVLEQLRAEARQRVS